MWVGGPYDIARYERAPVPPSPGLASAVPATAGGRIMLQDLTEATLLHEASDLLGVRHLSDAAGPVQYPVTGVLYGPCRRPLVCLPTALGAHTYKNIIYLVSTGAPLTELSPHAFEVLGGAAEAAPSAAHASINGQRHQVLLCAPNGNHTGVPVLGADGMAALGLKLHINYKAATVTLTDA